MAIMLTASVFAIAGNRDGKIRPEGVTYEWIHIKKTFDLYKVICTDDVCCLQGKCLGTTDAVTCLSVCGLTFDQTWTDYWVYNEDTGDLVGSCVGGVCVPVSISKPSEFGQVTYRLRIRTKHPDMPPPGTGAPSLLTGVTLCLAAATDNLVGSDYEQIHCAPTDLLELPGPGTAIGENIVLCPLP
jgi:hypothetical protein